MTRFLFLIGLVVFAACGGAAMQTVQLVNKTPRTIEQVFIFPPGKDHGASKAKLAPNASTTLQLPAGNHEIYAISEKIIHDDNTRETPEASLTIELRSALELVFYDSNAVPPGIDKPNTRGITFMIRPPAKKDEPVDGEPTAPAPPVE
ncbi:MAG: hypothetical protein AB7T06_46800 [Kofleriaceae bacterium]